MSHPHHPTLLHNRLPYFGRTGLVRNGLVAEYRFDESRNLLKYSQQFDNAAWTKTDCAIAANDTAAPDGTTTADKVTLTVGAAQSCVQSVTVAASTAYVFSIWVKLGTATALKYAIYNVSGSADIIAATSYGATTSWVRYAIPFTTPAGCTSVSIRPVKDSAQDNGTTAWIWGAQLEIGSVARTYYPTTDKQLLMDYSRPRKNLLLPNQANACEDGTTTGFSPSGATLSAEPTGTTAAWQGNYSLKVVRNNVDGYEGASTPILYGLLPNTTYTVSLYLKGAAGGESLRLRVFTRDDAGNAISSAATIINSLTTDWVRYSCAINTGATGRAIYLGIHGYPLQAATFYVDGLQLEEGSTATAWEAPPNIGYCGNTTGSDTNDPTYTGEGALCTTDDYFVIPNVFAGLTGCTVMIVANTTVQADYGGIIAGVGALAAHHSMNIREDLAASNKVYVQVSDGTSTTVCNLPTALTSALECITARFTGGSNIAARHNLGAWSSATTTITALNPDTTKAHYISRYAGAYFRTGSTCYCVVYNRALTDAEITQNYNYLKSYLLRERGISI